MVSPLHDLAFPEPAEGGAWINDVCPHCSVNAQMFVVARTDVYSPNVGAAWVRCVNCFRGSVVNEHAGMSPLSLPLDEPLGLKEAPAATWKEARTCLAAGANTAAVMMCRKLLMHMAVEEGLPEKDNNDRAPSFFACIEYLEHENVISKRNRKWVDRIKDIGNEANHDLKSTDKDQALTVATFTRQLLREVYELPYLEENT